MVRAIGKIRTNQDKSRQIVVAHLFTLWRNRRCEIRLYGIRHACIMFSLYLLTRVVCYWSHIKFAQRTYWWWLPPLVEPSLLWELVSLSLASHERLISQSHVVVFYFYAVVDKAKISCVVVVVRKWWWWFANGGDGSQAWCPALTLYDLIRVSAPKIVVISCFFLRQAQPIMCELATITFFFLKQVASCPILHMCWPYRLAGCVRQVIAG